MRKPRKITAVAVIHPFEAQEAAHTIARAQKHLASPHMMKAVRAHLDGLSTAVNGAMRPGGAAKRRGLP